MGIGYIPEICKFPLHCDNVISHMGFRPLGYSEEQITLIHFIDTNHS